MCEFINIGENSIYKIHGILTLSKLDTKNSWEISIYQNHGIRLGVQFRSELDRDNEFERVSKILLDNKVKDEEIESIKFLMEEFGDIGK